MTDQYQGQAPRRMNQTLKTILIVLATLAAIWVGSMVLDYFGAGGPGA